MKGNILSFNSLKSLDQLSKCSKLKPVQNIYMGHERRNERRRDNKNERVDTLIKNFGLNRRLPTERRQVHTSWLLTSQKVVNE